MKNKKKSLSKDHTSDNNRPYENKQIGIGPNGLVNYTPLHVLSNNARAACHLHSEPIEFRTFKEMRVHMIREHDYRKF